LSTVRIYRVAELLNTTSQEVTALLKRDHGIEVKSASSTIEEVVARQFVDRLSKQRNITLPTGDIFAEAPPVKGKKPTPPAKKGAEPAKPAAPMLPPPRLVKTAKPAVAAIVEPEPATDDAPPPVAEPAPEVHPEPIAQVERSHGAETPAIEKETHVAPPVADAPVAEASRAEATPVRPASPTETPLQKSGRVVPPTLRLRIEEQRPTTPTPPLPTTPAPRIAPRTKAAQPSARAATPAARPSATPVAARPGAPATARPGGAMPPRPVARPPQMPMGGPRPLPSQPIRPQSPGGAPRPGQPYGQRPGMPQRPQYPGFRPPGARPSGPRREPGPRQPAAMSAPAAPMPVSRTITFAEGMTVKDLADKLEVKVNALLGKMLMKGIRVTINSTLDPETATTIAREFGADVKMQSFEEELLLTDTEEARAEDVITRAPVVTVMGHVDHGKTSLLDAIREARVAEREAGGITQHIGAYHVTINKRNIVFLDTPGHEAFTLMRARGAKVTDIVVLVVAADDGVMPQTREAIDHARAANVPIIVAINKIDKPNAQAERVKRELTELDLMPEEWGGKTVTVEVSAKKKQNLDLLLEMILLVSEIGELKANPKRSATGTVLEAKLDKGRGPVATVLVQDGTLSVGDTFIAGPIVGRVRALIDDRGRPTKSAGPSTPVEVLGLTGLPQPGDVFQVADAARARQIATFREEQAKSRALGAKGGRLTLESLQAQISESGLKELPIIIKADVQGSAEVLADTLAKLTDEKVKLRIIHSGVGAVNESDVLLASASNAVIIAFNVRPDRNAEEIATRERVDIRQHSVIYNVTDEMKKAMAGLLEPTFKEVRIGVAAVRDTFKVPKYGTIAGCMVTEGRITRAGDTQARLLRDNVVIYEGKIGSLRRFKDDVSEVKSGFECGIGFEKYNDIKVGDVIEAFVKERVAVTA
jgi:translation initiation factor IF-2